MAMAVAAADVKLGAVAVHGELTAPATPVEVNIAAADVESRLAAATVKWPGLIRSSFSTCGASGIYGSNVILQAHYQHTIHFNNQIKIANPIIWVRAKVPM